MRATGWGDEHRGAPAAVRSERPLTTQPIDQESPTVPWVESPSLDLDLAVQVERRYDHVPRDAVERGHELLEAISEQIPGAAQILADGVRLRTGGRWHREAVTLAGLVGSTWRSVVMANITYDLMLLRFGCSTAALATPSGPVLARNMDWSPADVLARTSYLIRYVENGPLRFANPGWPGAIGVVTGLSAQGYGVALNAVVGPERVDKTGYPVLLFLRRVLEDANGFTEAVDMITTERLAAPGLFTVVGTSNDERVVIERTPRRHAQRWPDGDGPLYATNDYRTLFKPETSDTSEIYQTTCRRYDALQQLFADHTPDADIPDSRLLYALTDPTVLQQMTAQHVILRPRAQYVRMFIPRRHLPPASITATLRMNETADERG